MATDTSSLPPDPASLDPQGVVLRFLESVGRPSEARYYLDLFRARPREQFAVIAIDAHVVADAVDAVVQDLRFLAGLGLFPTVVLGLFQPADAASQARRLARRLQVAGVASTALRSTSGDLAAAVLATVGDDTIPIVTFEPGDAPGPAERFASLSKLLGALATRKLLFLHRPGGLRQGGQLVPLVNLSTDVPALVASRQLSRKETLILEQARRLVEEHAAAGLVVAVTSPLVLLRELFTVKGAGTLLRRGARILRHEGWEGVDRERMRQLLDASFGRPTSEAFFGRPVARIYRDESWRGAAVVIAAPLGSYLSKFAVTPEAQGEGIARDLWDDVAADHPTLLWRARASNPINEWYAKLCEGFLRSAPWHVYWKGLPAERISEAIAWVLAQPVDVAATVEAAAPVAEGTDSTAPPVAPGGSTAS